MDFTDIYMNQTKIQEIFNHQEARTERFKRQEVLNHKSYGNKIFKKRYDEYFDCLKADRYKTPFLRLRDHHRWNIAKLTKAQKRQEVEWLEQRRQRKIQLIPNYIAAYEDDRVQMTSENLVSTLNKLGDESNVIFERSQNTQENQTTKFLIEALAKAKLDQMSVNELTTVMKDQQNKAKQQQQQQYEKPPKHQRAPSQLTEERVDTKSSLHTECSRSSNSGRSSDKRIEKHPKGSKEVNPMAPKRQTTLFSFEERFKAFVGAKVIDNMQLLQEKRREEFNQKVGLMVSGDIDKNFSNAEFRSNIDAANPDNMLLELTQQFIHRAIIMGVKAQKEGLKPYDYIAREHKEFKKQNEAKLEKAAAKKRGKAAMKTSIDSSITTTLGSELLRPEDVLFMPNLGLDYSGIKSMYDIKDRETLFQKVQFVIENVDKERFKAFRSGALSLTQCISRIESESKNGFQYKVLDDLRDGLDPQALKNPSKAVKMAYQEQVIEDRLLRNAKKRGIDPVLLKKTARNLNVMERCAKSIYARPKSVGMNPDTIQNNKIKMIVQEQNQRRKAENDKKKHDDLVEAIDRKDKNTKRVLKELAKKDPRAIYRDSVESKVINQKLYGQKYYFIPERYRESLLAEFYKTYEAEKKNLALKVSTASVDSSAQKIKSKRMTKEQRQEKNQEAQRKKKEAEASWFEQMGIQQPMDNNQRNYLKRVRAANPQAKVVLPEGFYDSDEEEEARQRKLIAKRMSSNLMVYEYDAEGNLQGQSPVSKKKSQASYREKHRRNSQKAMEAPMPGMQFLQARSFGGSPTHQSLQSNEDEDTGIIRHGETLSDHQGEAYQEQFGIRVERLEKHTASIDLRLSHSAQHLSEEVSLEADDDQYGEHQEGGIIEDPKQRKRTVSAYDQQHQVGSALDGINEETMRKEYKLIGVTGDEDQFMSQYATEVVNGRNAQIQQVSKGNLLLEYKKSQSNFPLNTFQTAGGKDSVAVSKNLMMESTAMPDTIFNAEPNFKNSPIQTRTLAKNQSQAFTMKRKSYLNKSVSNQQQRMNRTKDKGLSNETLVIGGLVKRPTSVVKKNSAQSKEYHQRHTRHIRGQSALSRPAENTQANNYFRYNRSSLQSTSFDRYETNLAASQSIKNQQVPESVLEWYNEMIGPMQVTQKVPKASDDNSLLDCAATDAGTDAHASSVFCRPRGSRGVSSKSSKMNKSKTRRVAKKKQIQRVALVGQQTPFMTLNQDITDEDIIDFAFTVQGKNQSSKGVASGPQTVKDRHTVKDFLISQGQNQPTSQARNTNVDQNSSLSQTIPGDQIIEGDLVKETQSMPDGVHTNVNSLDLKSENQYQQQRGSYNWLTGAAMTNQNQEKLQNIIVDKAGSKSVFIHERAPRQLLVNQSVLRRNQMYRQQSAAIQTGTPQHATQDDALLNDVEVRQELPKPVTKFIDPSTPTPGRTSNSERYLYQQPQQQQQQPLSYTQAIPANLTKVGSSSIVPTDYLSQPNQTGRPIPVSSNSHQQKQMQQHTAVINTQHGSTERGGQQETQSADFGAPIGGSEVSGDKQAIRGAGFHRWVKSNQNSNTNATGVQPLSGGMKIVQQASHVTSPVANSINSNAIGKTGKRGIQIGGTKPPSASKSTKLNNMQPTNSSPQKSQAMNVVVKGRNIAGLSSNNKSQTRSPTSPFEAWKASLK